VRHRRGVQLAEHLLGTEAHLELSAELMQRYERGEPSVQLFLRAVELEVGPKDQLRLLIKLIVGGPQPTELVQFNPRGFHLQRQVDQRSHDDEGGDDAPGLGGPDGAQRQEERHERGDGQDDVGEGIAIGIGGCDGKA
jgi:hypothetical protein